MQECDELRRAREHLARAESGYRTSDGLSHLEEGLALLEDVMLGAATAHHAVARNLASTYADRIISRIESQIGNDPGAPEPELEHLFKVIIAFDEVDVELPEGTRALKLRLARRLIDRYYEGHGPAAKARALEDLAAIAGVRAAGKTRKR
jgi:hypothetical protein